MYYKVLYWLPCQIGGFEQCDKPVRNSYLIE